MDPIESQEKFADDIVNYIISRVTGTHSEDDIINEKPSKSFLIGTLAARKEQDGKDEVKSSKEALVYKRMQKDLEMVFYEQFLEPNKYND